MNLEIRIALQNLVWERYKIEVPVQDMLLRQFTDYYPSALPSSVAGVNEFVQKTYSQFLEPQPGFIRSRAYMDDELSRQGINLERVQGTEHYFFDPVSKMYWSQRFDRNDTPWGFYFEGPTLVAPFRDRS